MDHQERGNERILASRNRSILMTRREIVFALSFCLVGIASPPQARLVNTADSLVVTSPDTLQLKARHHYNQAVLLVQGGRLFVTPVSSTPGDSSGFLWLDAPLIQVTDSAKVIADGRGYRGGIPEGGNGLGPGGGRGGLTYTGGGGGGYGGSGGRGGPSNGGGAGGPAYDSSSIFPGSGGGAGNQGGGAGGRGGGAIMLMANNTCTITGTLSAVGENADPTQVEGGGGGSGGGIFVQAPNVSLRGILSGFGGNGGDGGDNGGGGGGGGRLKVYFQSLDTVGLGRSVAGGQGGYGTIGEQGLPGNQGIILWAFYDGVNIRERGAFSGQRSEVVAVPNPAHGACEFRFSGREAQATLTLDIYGVSGRRMRTLRSVHPPSHSLWWDGRDEAGHVAPSGFYFFQAGTGRDRIRGKLLLVR